MIYPAAAIKTEDNRSNVNRNQSSPGMTDAYSGLKIQSWKSTWVSAINRRLGSRIILKKAAINLMNKNFVQDTLPGRGMKPASGHFYRKKNRPE